MVFVSYCEAWSKKVKKQYRTKAKTNKVQTNQPTTQKRGQRGSMNLSKIKVVSLVWVPGVVEWGSAGGSGQGRREVGGGSFL